MLSCWLPRNQLNNTETQDSQAVKFEQKKNKFSSIISVNKSSAKIKTGHSNFQMSPVKKIDYGL